MLQAVISRVTLEYSSMKLDQSRCVGVTSDFIRPKLTAARTFLHRFLLEVFHGTRVVDLYGAQRVCTYLALQNKQNNTLLK